MYIYCNRCINTCQSYHSSLSAVECRSCPFSLGLPVLELKGVADTVYQEKFGLMGASALKRSGGAYESTSFPRFQPSISSLYITLAAF